MRSSCGSEAQEQRTPSPREEIQKGLSFFKGAIMKYFPSFGQAILSGFTAGGTRCYCLDLIAIISPLLQMIVQLAAKCFLLEGEIPFNLALFILPRHLMGLRGDNPCFCPLSTSFLELMGAGSQGSGRLFLTL